MRHPLIILTLILPLISTVDASAATYEVGPGQTYTSIGAVPWESLNAGDTVHIHWRSTPYQEKWVINRTGTQAAPITVSGVAGPDGSLPVISGQNATTRSQLSYWARQREVIKVGGASIPGDAVASWIVIENLDVASARAPYTYTGPNGASEAYLDTASAIYVEIGDHITIRNCILRDSSNGLFSAYGPSSNILVTGCYIWGNGVSGSVYEHNVYTESSGITFEYNHLGPLRAGCPGNNLKDRSSGMVVRYNWIEGGNRQLDLVESQNSDLVAANLTNPAYHTSFVYGNVLVEPAGDGNRQMVHYGGDGNEPDYRKGTLYLYDNTLVSTRTDKTTMLRLSTNDEHCDARDNLVYVSADGSTLELLDDTGTLTFTNNWLKPGYSNSFFGAGAVTASGNVTGASPGFVNAAGQDFHLAAGSGCIGTATALAAAVLPANNVLMQYVVHQGSEARSDVQDIGAFARSGSGNSAPTVSLTSPAGGATFTAPATIALAANAADSDGTITKVEFYQGTTLLGSDTTAPYAFSWGSVAAGSYALTAKAYDNGGAVTTSATVTVTVNPAGNVAPTVSLTSPTAGATFTAPATIALAANAADSDGTITKVEFYQGTTLIGSDTTAPYAFSWGSVAAGSYALTAKAYDNAGAVTTSAGVAITVAAPPPAAGPGSTPDGGTSRCGLGTSFALLALMVMGRRRSAPGRR